MRRTGPAVLALAASAAAFVAAPRPAAATVSCGYSYIQPFAAWGDAGYYGLAPNGAFDSTGSAGWTLAGGAGVVAGGNTLRPASGAYALSLPAGSSVTSPPICVEAGSPWARMFARTTVRNSSYPRALKVELVFKDAVNGITTTRPVTTLAQRIGWSPAERMSLGTPVTIAPGTDGRTTVRYRFTPLYRTAWLIDDLFIDPKRHR